MKRFAVALFAFFLIQAAGDLLGMFIQPVSHGSNSGYSKEQLEKFAAEGMDPTGMAASG